jgi:hypothetical protein
MVMLRVTAKLMDSSGNPLGGKTIYFYVSGDGYTWFLLASVATDGNGYASTTYDASGRVWFKAEFKGDDQYEPSSAVVVWEPSEGQVAQPVCKPIVRTGIDVLDRILFCIGGYGVTVFVLIIVFVVLLLLARR